MAHRRTRRSKRKAALYTVIIAVVMAVLAVAYFFALQAEESSRTQARQTAAQTIGVRKKVRYHDQTYAEKTDLTSILLMGVDRDSGKKQIGARDGGQSDFLLLLVFDHPNRKIYRLQIDRDTMTPVEILGILGNPVGTQLMQITLAHAFGSTPQENCEREVQAVQNLLDGITIDYYMALNMNGIGVLNDSLGGIEVTLPEDYTAFDPEMEKGKTLKLTGDQAYIMTRYRMEIGDGSNQQRMHRQQVFMEALADTLRKHIGDEPDLIGELFDALDPYLTSSITRGRLLNEANRSYRYELQPLKEFEGEYKIGSDQFMEFYPAEGEVDRWVMQTFYEPVEDS
ncbi:MAG: LCP family protein [Clostridia bacterium]|nr:LCP family protein [Clostridia bacterium]